MEKQSSEISTSQQVNLVPSQYIQLNESGLIKGYIGRYSEPAPSKTFLLINMTIENKGYKAFYVNLNYFNVIIDNVAYPYDSATFSTNSPLSSLTLLEGGKTSGYLVFQIPKDATKYIFRYVGPGDYDIIYGHLSEISN